MLYIIVMFLIVMLVIRDIYFHKNYKYAGYAIFSLMVIMLVFRYGQGTDYFGYMFNYYNTPPIYDLNLLETKIHGEYGYIIITSIFRALNISFETFTALISIVSMLLIFKFLNFNSKGILISLLVFYSQLYIVYFYSGFRQGLTIALFLGALLPYLKKQKYIQYFFLTIVFSLLHSSILVVLLLLPLRKVEISPKRLLIVSITVFLFSLIQLDVLIINIAPEYLYNKIIPYIKDTQLPYMSIFTRIAMVIPIIYLDYKHVDLDEVSALKNYYYIGFIVYLLLVRYPLISARLTYYFKALEIILIPYSIKVISSIKLKKLNTLYIIIFLVFMIIKNLTSFLYEGNYYSDVTVLRYPYISVFNKSDIWNYRENSRLYDLLEKNYFKELK